MDQLDLRRVRYFLKLTETLNFSEAASLLKVTQSGLTKSIAQLEKDVGGQLLRREGKNTHLTQLGMSLVEPFEQVDQIARRAQETARRMVQGDMPVLRIGLMCTIGPHLMADFLTAYQRIVPDLEFVIRDLNRSELSGTLLNGEVDVALVGAEITANQRFRYSELYSEPMVVACAQNHRFATRASISIEDVMQEPYVDRLECEFRDTFLSEAYRRDFVPVFAARTDREEWAQTLVAKGAGVSVLPQHSTVVHGLALVPLNDPTLMRTVSLAVPIGREDTASVQTFLRAARSHDWGVSS